MVPRQQIAIRGKSAFELQSRNRRFGRYLALGMFIGGGIDLISWGQQNLVHTLALIVLYVSLALGMFVWGPMQIVANFREVAEVRAGYTTMRDAHQDVQEVEPGTFRLVRQAGEPYITEEQRLQRLSSTPGPYVNTSPGVVRRQTWHRNVARHQNRSSDRRRHTPSGPAVQIHMSESFGKVKSP